MSQPEWMHGAVWSEFRESTLMKQALTHPSCAQTRDGLPYNNQRLEFLGDAVLGMVVTQMLYEMYPHEQEGELARRLSALVCGERLVEVARSIDLGAAMILSASEEDHDGRTNASNLEDACEALIGALYLDGGFEAAQQFIYQHWYALAQAVTHAPKDAKTSLQEWAQARGLPLPEYVVTSETGPAHAPLFTIEVRVKNKEAVQATAANKKLAERMAAEMLLAKL